MSIILPMSLKSAQFALDKYTNLEGIYSIARRLKRTYIGNAITVRRTSDDVERDIGFIAGRLDLASLESFVGGSSGAVKRVYDQSGNGFHMEQNTSVSQPLIVSAGSTYMLGGKPAIRFAGAQWLQNTSVSGGNNTSKFISVTASVESSTINGGRLVSFSSPGQPDHSGNGFWAAIYFSTDNTIRSFINESFISTPISVDTEYIIQARIMSSTIGIWKSSTENETTGVVPNLSYTQFLWGKENSVDASWKGLSNELISFNTSPNYSDRSEIRSLQSQFYNIP